MEAFIGRNMNSAGDASIPGAISVGDSTSTVLLAENKKRISVTISVQDADIWVKEQAAIVDDDKKGLPVYNGETATDKTDNVYTGEISAIAEDGTAQVYVTEI